MDTFKRRSKRGKITIVRRTSKGGTTLGIAIGHSNIKKAIAKDEIRGLTKLRMSKAFDIYKKSEPGLLEKFGVIPNRKTQKNPYR